MTSTSLLAFYAIGIMVTTLLNPYAGTLADGDGVSYKGTFRCTTFDENNNYKQMTTNNPSSTKKINSPLFTEDLTSTIETDVVTSEGANKNVTTDETSVFTSKGEAENLTSEPTTAKTYSTSKDTSTRDSTTTAEATIVTSEDASTNEYVTSEIIISSKSTKMTQKSAYTSGETTSQPHVTSTTFMTTMKKTQETYSTDKKTTVNTECQHPRGNYCYELFYDDKVLFDAHNHCRNLGTGSNLVSILDIEEALFLRDLITSSSLEPLSDYWIGLNSNRYRWGDGKSLFYANFHTKFVPGDCASMDSPEMKWTAVDCTKNKNFLCEGSLSTIATGSCDHSYKDSCYKLSDSSETITFARFQCFEYGGRLLQVETHDEQEYLKSHFNTDIWIDLNTTAAGFGYSWIGGNTADFTDFVPDYESDIGICFVMDSDHGFRWNAGICDSARNYICKWPL